ncbi:helix-turn-helix domain-containing protein [Streptosporangium sandarakinum]|uniref:helix-turn-helix domain-containing protein n=1 Tax=Streptosporangium sandarakinum TaxID=1260955 RepID=UPI00339EB8ED
MVIIKHGRGDDKGEKGTFASASVAIRIAGTQHDRYVALAHFGKGASAAVSVDSSDETRFSVWLTQMARAMGYPTDASLAEALGISPSTILRWRRGSKPSVTHLVRLSTTLGVRLEGLLALAGHVDPQVLGPKAELPEPPSSVTETVRRIRGSSMSEQSQEVLTRYWNSRLAEERGRAYELIRIIEGAERGELDVVEDLAKILTLTSQSQLSKHLVDLLREVTDILGTATARPRRGRRHSPHERLQFILRRSQSDRVRLEVLGFDGTVLSAKDEFESLEAAKRQLERSLGVEPDAIRLLDEE